MDAFTETRFHRNAMKDKLNQGLHVLTNPIEDSGKAKFMPLHRALDECLSF